MQDPNQADEILRYKLDDPEAEADRIEWVMRSRFILYRWFRRQLADIDAKEPACEMTPEKAKAVLKVFRRMRWAAWDDLLDDDLHESVNAVIEYAESDPNQEPDDLLIILDGVFQGLNIGLNMLDKLHAVWFADYERDLMDGLKEIRDSWPAGITMEELANLHSSVEKGRVDKIRAQRLSATSRLKRRGDEILRCKDAYQDELGKGGNSTECLIAAESKVGTPRSTLRRWEKCGKLGPVATPPTNDADPA